MRLTFWHMHLKLFYTESDHWSIKISIIFLYQQQSARDSGRGSYVTYYLILLNVDVRDWIWDFLHATMEPQVHMYLLDKPFSMIFLPAQSLQLLPSRQYSSPSKLDHRERWHDETLRSCWTALSHLLQQSSRAHFSLLSFSSSCKRHYGWKHLALPKFSSLNAMKSNDHITAFVPIHVLILLNPDSCSALKGRLKQLYNMLGFWFLMLFWKQSGQMPMHYLF